MDLRTDGEASRGFDTPEDWNSSSLSAIAEKIADGEHLTPRRTRQGYLLLSARNVLDGCLDLDDVDYVGPDEYARIRRRCDPNEGDILISCSGSIGRVALVPPGLECVMVRSAAFVRINAAVANAAFIQYYLQSAAGQLQIANSLNQGAQANLFLGPIGALRVALPPLAEQKAIASALSDVDALLGALDRLIAKKRDLKQAAMQQLLTGQTRLPGFSGKWETKRLGNFSPLQRGFDLPNPELRSGPFPVVYSNGILNHHTQFQVRGPGVVTGRSGTLGKVVFVEDDYWPHNTSLWVTSFRGNNPKFVYYVLKSVGLDRFASGSGVPTLNRNDVHAYAVTVPSSIEEQDAIVAALTDIDAELTALEERRDKTRLLKQGMMQELLTGRTRLV